MGKEIVTNDGSQLMLRPPWMIVGEWSDCMELDRLVDGSGILIELI